MTTKDDLVRAGMWPTAAQEVIDAVAGAEQPGNFTNLTASGTTTLSGLTASTLLKLDSSKRVVSSQDIGVATGTSLALTGAVTSTGGAGAVNGGTLTAVEQGDTVVHKTIITLTGTPLTFTDDPGVGQWATYKLYDAPAGDIMVLGATINATLTLTETWWTDTEAGSVGVGSTANADASAIATTRQNIIPNTAIAAMVAQAGPVTGQSTAAYNAAVAGGTDLDVILNIRLDDSAAHMPDAVTNGAFTGNANDWTLGDGWAYGTNNVAATLADTALEQTVTGLQAGVSYSLTYTTTRTAGSVQPSLGGTAGTSRNTANTFTETIIAGGDGTLKFTGTGFSGTIDTVSLTPLTGTGTISGTVTLVWANFGDF